MLPFLCVHAVRQRIYPFHLPDTLYIVVLPVVEGTNLRTKLPSLTTGLVKIVACVLYSNTDPPVK